MSTDGAINDVIRASFDEVGGEVGQKVILIRGDSWREPVANSAALPLTGNNVGDMRETLDDYNLHSWNGSAWIIPTISGGVTTDQTVGQTIGSTGARLTKLWATDITVTNAILAGGFIPNSATIPSNGMYLPASNTLGWAINSAIELQLTSTALSPGADDGLALGTTALGWQSLFGDTGFVLNIENGNWVATHTTGILTVGTGDLRVTTAGSDTASVVTVGGAQTLTSKVLTSATITTLLSPTSNDGAALGSTTLQFSDLFLAEGGVINWDNGDLTLTQTGNELIMAGGNFDVGAGNILRLTAGATIKLTVPTSDLTATGPTCGDFNCGYSSSAIGDLVYLDSSSTWQKSDANTLALYNGFLGIALEVKASANALLVALPGSFIYSTTGFPTWTIGGPIYMSETAGAMTQTQPVTTDAAIRVVGWGIHADKMYFYPEPGYITHT